MFAENVCDNQSWPPSLLSSLIPLKHNRPKITQENAWKIKLKKQILFFSFDIFTFCRYLLSRGADVNAVDNEQHSALHWAIVCGELEALDLLHKAGANPSIPDNHGALPIHYAVQMCSAGSSANREKQMICQLGLQRLLTMGVDIR